LDTCRRPYDQQWLDYQQEIALRHTRAKKNRTDGAQETPEHIPLRYVVAFVYPITATIKQFLAKGGPLRRRGREDARRLVQVGNAAGRPVGSTVLEGRGFLAWA